MKNPDTGPTADPSSVRIGWVVVFLGCILSASFRAFTSDRTPCMPSTTKPSIAAINASEIAAIHTTPRKSIKPTAGAAAMSSLSPT